MKRAHFAVIASPLLVLGALAAGELAEAAERGGGLPAAATATKMELWLQPGFFRGFDIGYFNSGLGNKELQDFRALQATGANVAQIQNNEGTRDWASPYAPNPDGVDGLEQMVGFCDELGLYYIIAVRAGPGRQPVDVEARDTIWENATEQQLYAEMLRDDIVARYHEDPLFVGINVMVEPNPFNVEIADGTLDGPGELAAAMAERGIDVNALMTGFISEIRSVDATLPIIVQSVGWSGPEWWSLLEKQDDPNVIYDFHTYAPRELTHPDCQQPNCAGVSYPRVYDGATWDRGHIEGTHLAEVVRFQETHGVPILMGEFGMQFEQSGGVQFLSDMVDIAIDRGWHFCIWNFRSDTLDPMFLDFDYEKWEPAYWSEVLTWWQTPAAAETRLAIPR